MNSKKKEKIFELFTDRYDRHVMTCVSTIFFMTKPKEEDGLVNNKKKKFFFFNNNHDNLLIHVRFITSEKMK